MTRRNQGILLAASEDDKSPTAWQRTDLEVTEDSDDEGEEYNYAAQVMTYSDPTFAQQGQLLKQLTLLQVSRPHHYPMGGAQSTENTCRFTFDEFDNTVTVRDTGFDGQWIAKGGSWRHDRDSKPNPTPPAIPTPPPPRAPPTRTENPTGSWQDASYGQSQDWSSRDWRQGSEEHRDWKQGNKRSQEQMNSGDASSWSASSGGWQTQPQGWQDYTNISLPSNDEFPDEDLIHGLYLGEDNQMGYYTDFMLPAYDAKIAAVNAKRTYYVALLEPRHIGVPKHIIDERRESQRQKMKTR
jgi:hypothetical protein